ncbi:integrase [Actinobacillus delphinicola]|uniref:phage integrase N-terminal domain-containing protein n=1 Tax=Actinobacillus delphinicola TaxID=51161 RepID=UPI00244222C8|nr:phage integrase N-terminal domain-containing protein [Actinobacillus delphinicola]MDG6898078.1 integrase [Actinobacillus delphinicola]MDG6898085.1 integrase [Actinobacillus delphinicola]MDG6898092.1 integrase [Actinobacillus delphinicola]
MKNLVFSLNNLMKSNKEDSFATRAEREKHLRKSMMEILEKYNNLNDVKQLKTRHIEYLVERWKNKGLSPGTIKNQLSYLRWLSRKINKPNIVRRNNSEYNVDKRTYVNNENKGKTLNSSKMALIKEKNPSIYYSLRLQEQFGLRREESIKFQPEYADKGDHIILKQSWCKGGRPRTIPVETFEQRMLLDEITIFCKNQNSPSLIPKDHSYYNQLKAYEYLTTTMGEIKNHGNRHQYAQDIYEKLTGMKPPVRGGKTYREMTKEERDIDRQARLEISKRLGHNREEITAVYLGR